MDVLLSIKPVYVDRILNRQKFWEFRKTIFKKKPVDRVVIYSSSPVKRIVASFKPGMILSGTPNYLWKILGPESGMCYEDFFGYFGGNVYSLMKTGYAIEITDLKTLPEPIDPVAMMPSFRAPQSFCYWNALPMPVGGSSS